MTINPNSAYHKVFQESNLSDAGTFPRFIHAARFEKFRHIPELLIDFRYPVTILSGTNKSGKTTALLSIACSHFEFKKRNYTNGKLERQTWSDVLKVTNHDAQVDDWTYYLDIKTGAKKEWKRGQRKVATKKWNGLGKKESQIKNVQVVYLDLDRILPARHYSPVLHHKARAAVGVTIASQQKQKMIEEYLSYILEEDYKLKKLADHLGRDVFGFSAEHSYSSYNSASGEDVLSRILVDCVEAPKNALILIDELELGLHPKVQRRLLDVIFCISSAEHKQFIITSHSATALSCVPDGARVFIESKNGVSTPITPISINAALSKMDSKDFPLVDVFCEDETAKWIIEKALAILETRQLPSISSKLLNVIVSGSATDTHQNFKVRSRIYDDVKVKSGHACILDGDMRGKHSFPKESGLFFLPGTEPPEKWLARAYVAKHKSKSFSYHVGNSNVHILFSKMVEVYAGLADSRAAFEACWSEYVATPASQSEMEELVDFLHAQCTLYSPDL